MDVRCKIEQVILNGMFGPINSVRATCLRCGRSEESYGTSERSIRRCFALLRENCLRGEANYYMQEEESRQAMWVVLRRKNSGPQELAESADAVREIAAGRWFGPVERVVGDWQLDWDKLRATTGSYEGAYAWAAQTFDAFVLVPLDGCVARGQYSIATRALEYGKLVYGPDRRRVARLDVAEKDNRKADWKGAYARVVYYREEEQQQQQQPAAPQPRQQQQPMESLEVRRLFRLDEEG